LQVHNGLPRPAWLWFLIFGGLLYLGNRLIFPPPPPVLGPPNPADIAALTESFTQLAGRAPTADEQAGFIDQWLREALLFREAIDQGLHLSDPAIQQRLIRNMRFLEPETRQNDAQLIERALALNMHLTDEVIRRRLVQGMSMLLIASADVAPPDIDALEAAFKQRRDALMEPAQISFYHRLLGDIASDEAARVLDSLITGNTPPEEAAALGEPFVFGHAFEAISWVEVSARFGPAFTRRLRAMIEASPDITGWVGPVASTFGQHVLFIEKFAPARQQTFEEAESILRADLMAEREQAALDQAIARLMSRYEMLTQ
jgi:hypothetical protein